MLHDDVSIRSDAETCLFCDAFRLNVGLQLLSHLTSENYKLTALYVIDFLGSSYDSLWWAKILVSLLAKCDQEGAEA